MKKLAALISFICSITVYSQIINFTVISDPKISDSKSAALLDSSFNQINRKSDLDFVVVLGELTTSGTVEQFDILKKSLSILSKQYLLLPGVSDLRNAEGWESLKEISDDKFSFEKNGFKFIGLSPVIPFSKLNHFSVENIDWLNNGLDSIKAGEEIYFLTTSRFDAAPDNRDTILSLFYGKNLQLIIEGANEKQLLKNLNGYYLVDTPLLSNQKNQLPTYSIVKIKKDSIEVSDSQGKITAVIDKTISIKKDSVHIPEVQNFGADIIMQTVLNSTMITSTSYWNSRIYTSDASGLVSCIDSTGKVLWDYDASGNIYGKPVIADRMLTLATYQGDLVTISAISGEQIQSIGFEETITSDLSLLNYEGDNELMIPKLSKSKKSIVFGTASGKIFCYDLETLQQYWVNDDAKGMIRTKPVIQGNKILFTSRDGYLYCIDARNGLLIWRWKEKAETDLSDSPVYCDGKKVFIISKEGNIYAINLLLGKLEWKLDNLSVTSNFGISEDHLSIYILGKNSSFYTIETSNGKISKEIKSIGAFTESLDYPVNYDSNIFYSAGGTIYKINGKSNPEKILFTGNAPIHPLINISGNKFLTSNIDGQIIIFSLR